MNKEAEILNHIIKNRRSVMPSSYLKKAISKETILYILETANYAPTHKLTQPWRFVVIRQSAKAKLANTLASLYKAQVSEENFLQKKYDSFAEKAHQAECILAINLQISGRVPEWEELAAVACAVQNIALTAESLGIGGYWSTPPLIHSLGEFLHLAENEKCIGLFYMGYKNDDPYKLNRTPIEHKIQWMEGE